MCTHTEFEPLDFSGVYKELSKLDGKYPFVRLSSIGKSVMGRDIFSLRVGRAASYVLFAAAFHGSEYITCTLLIAFIKRLICAIDSDGCIDGVRIKTALSGRGLIFVPLVNPDGCEISLKGKAGCGAAEPFISGLCKGDYTHFNANARGVDINHNFDADWKALKKRELDAGIISPAPTRFGGYQPASEPETVSLTTLCKSFNIRHAIALHSQGEVIYPPDGANPPARSLKMAEIMSASSGYKIEYPEGLASGGGFKDWFVKEFLRPAFTIEIGKGKNPLPKEVYPETFARISEMLTLCSIM